VRLLDQPPDLRDNHRPEKEHRDGGRDGGAGRESYQFGYAACARG
jgi:hypothetical protein